MMITKSDYVAYRICKKLAWLRKQHPELAQEDENARSRMETGEKVGALARGLFGDSVCVYTQDEQGRPDIRAMIDRTADEMRKATSVICEAAFLHDDCYCAVDLLRRESGGWAIYEVKSSTEAEQDRYSVDVAYQKYVLESCGVPVTGCYLVCINSQYVLQGELDLQGFFKITEFSEQMSDEYAAVPEEVKTAHAVLQQIDEPDEDLNVNCQNCAYWPYCSRHLPKPNVFDLYRMSMSEKLKRYRQHYISFEELLASGTIKNDKQRWQIDFAVSDRGTWIDQKGIQTFLDTLSYPLYFLDFETMQPAIPFCQGTRPYSQIPFQYSLHVIEQEGGPLEHREYLAESGTDPRRALAEALCKDIPMNVCVTAYNKAFECTRLNELAATFPDLAEHLTNISENIRDLLTPFQKGYYYNRAMGGSFSIKSVLPALYPDDPSLDYHQLEGVHNGGEAMSVFPKIRDMPPEEQERARHNLLKYCELDTYAMVKVWEELVRVSSEEGPNSIE